MTGMNKGLGSNNPVIVSAFHTSVTSQLLLILSLVVVLALAWSVARTVLLRRQARARDLGAAVAQSAVLAGTEPRARLVLRLCFGVLWTLDGLLQLQPAMPLGLPGGVFSSAAAGAPSWVHRTVNLAVNIWSEHPITAATSAVWIQLGIGIALLVAPRGTWSRWAGAASAGWGLVVWVFGEAFGGVFTPGASWLFGLPGAALFYVAAGALLALPEASWRTQTLGRRLLRVMGVFFIGMGVLQAWPGRGTWVGRSAHGGTGLTASMSFQMSQVPQPGWTHSVVLSFANFAAAHGWAVNLVVVCALVVAGACLLTADRRVALVGLAIAIVLCLADWLLVQDLGFFGGVGTDPNSMLPTLALLATGYVALRLPSGVPATEPEARERAGLVSRSPVYLLQVAAAVLAGVVVVIGAAPMAVASLRPGADAILTEAVNGTPQHTDFPAFGFRLVDQRDHAVDLSQFKGHVVVLTFLDPVCTTSCPLVAQELLGVDRTLAGTLPSIELVAVDANPSFRSRGALVEFDRVEHLTHVRNWEYLTGSLGELTAVWDEYAAGVATSGAGAMAAHADLVYVIDPAGAVRSIITADPGQTAATQSSLGTLVTQEVERVQALHVAAR